MPKSAPTTQKETPASNTTVSLPAGWRDSALEQENKRFNALDQFLSQGNRKEALLFQRIISPISADQAAQLKGHSFVVIAGESGKEFYKVNHFGRFSEYLAKNVRLGVDENGVVANKTSAEILRKAGFTMANASGQKDNTVGWGHKSMYLVHEPSATVYDVQPSGRLEFYGNSRALKMAFPNGIDTNEAYPKQMTNSCWYDAGIIATLANEKARPRLTRTLGITEDDTLVVKQYGEFYPSDSIVSSDPEKDDLNPITIATEENLQKQKLSEAPPGIQAIQLNYLETGGNVYEMNHDVDDYLREVLGCKEIWDIEASKGDSQKSKTHRGVTTTEVWASKEKFGTLLDNFAKKQDDYVILLAGIPSKFGHVWAVTNIDSKAKELTIVDPQNPRRERRISYDAFFGPKRDGVPSFDRLILGKL